MEIETASRAFAALSQPTRLEVLRVLVKAGPGGLAAGDLARAVGAPASTLSFHLKELSGADLIQSRRDGRHVVYTANYGGVRGLVDFLMADCCQGDPRLCGPYIIEKQAS